MTYKPERNQFISFARGFAMLTIVLYHYINKTSDLPNLALQIANIGGGGVHLFIFASGFGLALSSYKGYAFFLKKRFVSVLIPYILTIFLIFLLSIFFGVYSPDFSAFLSHIFLYKMFFEKYIGSFGTHFWFISTIIQFYLAFPVIRYFTLRFTNTQVLVGSFALSLFYGFIVLKLGYSDLRTWNSFFMQYLWEFVLGIVVARTNVLSRFTSLKFWQLIIGLSMCYLVMFLMVKFWPLYGKSFNDLFSFGGYLGLALLVYRVSLFIKLLERFVNWVTAFSYSLFLTHMLVFNCNAKFLMDSIYLREVVFIFFETLLIGWIYNFLIQWILSAIKERPILNGDR